MSNIQLKKLNLIYETERKRKHFRFLIKNEIKMLHEEDFTNLLIECLHSNHYPLLEEYIRIGDILHSLLFNKINTIQDTSTIRKNISDMKYLYKSHRKTLTCLLVDMVSDGYTPELTEWFALRKILILNK